jgi:hypothetical protein
MKRVSSGIMRRFTSALTATVVLMNLANAAGDLVWFNGSFNNVNGLASERNTDVSDSRTYDNFSLPSGYNQVTGLLGQFYLTSNLVNAPVYWEIRQGAAPGTGGTLIASGTQLGATYTAIGSGFGFTIYEIRMKLNNPVNLAPNTVYWMTMAPVGNGSGRAFVCTTSGAGAIGTPIGGDDGLIDSVYFGLSWFPANVFVGEGQANFAYGVQAIPEPASMLALGAGLAGLLGLRRRARK